MVSVFSFLGACAGGSDGKNALIRLTPEMMGSNCPNGGFSVKTGLDKNSNGTLDDDEVDATQTKYACNGAPGTAGATGATGAAGATGATGATGDAGADGTNGANGTNGAPGDAGVDGLSALTVVTKEPRGANCKYGGTRIDVGLDTNRNRVLDQGEITGTQYACDSTSIDAVYYGSISIETLADLTQLDGVQAIIGDLYVNVPPGTTFAANELIKVTGTIGITTGTGTGGGGNQTLTGLVNISFPVLTQVGYLYIQRQEDLATLSAPVLKNAYEIHVTENPLLTTLDLGALERLDYGYFDNNDALASLSLPKLISTGYFDIENNSLLTSLDFPSIKYVCD